MSGDSCGPTRGGGQKTTPDYCKAFVGETLVNSPDPSILSIISIGDELDVISTVLEGVSVIALSNATGILGGLLNYSNILEKCIDQGFDYKATVTELKGAVVKVRITTCI